LRRFGCDWATATLHHSPEDGMGTCPVLHIFRRFPFGCCKQSKRASKIASLLVTFGLIY
jgi:hypothetical protein